LKLAQVRRRLVSPLADGLSSPLARIGISADTLTVLGLLASVSVGLLVYQGMLVTAGLVFLVAGVFDLLDGALARRLGQPTRLGALLDSTLDRLGEAAVFLGILLFFLGEGDDWGAALTLSALSASSLVSYINARGDGLGLVCGVGLFTRPERVIVIILGLFLDQLLIAVGLITLLSLLTAAQRFLHLRRAARS
jgi:CDP-diacylglycerol--glycerol-3-phosphate 3-phosphatidyltransferase